MSTSQLKDSTLNFTAALSFVVLGLSENGCHLCNSLMVKHPQNVILFNGRLRMFGLNEICYTYPACRDTYYTAYNI